MTPKRPSRQCVWRQGIGTLSRAWWLFGKSRFTVSALIISVVAGLLPWLIDVDNRQPLERLAFLTALPLVPGTLGIVPLGSPFRMIERSLPRNVALWNVIAVCFILAAFTAAVGMSALSSEGAIHPADLALDAAGHVGVMLLWAAFFDPRLAWLPSITWTVIVLVPFVNDASLLNEFPSGLHWWPVLPGSGEILAVELGLFLVGVLVYVILWRYDWTQAVNRLSRLVR